MTLKDAKRLYLTLILAATAPAAFARTSTVTVTNTVGSWSPSYYDGDYYREWTMQEEPLVTAWLWGQGHEGLWAFYYANFEEGVHGSDENYYPTNGVPLNVGGYLWTVDSNWVLTQYEVVTHEIVAPIGPIHADYAKMFVGGGEWLPDYVPDAAIYDVPAGAYKELRYTTNVQAAAAAVISGYLERLILAQEIAYDYHGNDPPWRIGSIDWATNNLDNHHPGGRWPPSPFLYASNRCVSTRRAVIWPTLDTIRNELLDLPRRGNYSDFTGCWGSSQFAHPSGVSLEFPEFGWFGLNAVEPTNLLQRVGSLRDWSWVWPEYDSVATDAVWRVYGPTNHDGLVSALSFWNYDNGAYLGAIETNAAATTCYEMLTARFGDLADRFTNETRRLSYYGLGTLEAALSTMDTTYQQFRPQTVYFQPYSLSYRHVVSSEADMYIPVSVTYTNGQWTADWDTDYNWYDHEYYETTSNRVYMTSEPGFALDADVVFHGGTVQGNIAPIEFTYDMAYTVLTNYYPTPYGDSYPWITPDYMKVFFTPTAEGPAIEYQAWMVDYFSTNHLLLASWTELIDLTLFTNSTLHLEASVSAQRNAKVYITADEIVSQWGGISSWADRQLAYYHPEVRLNSLEDFCFSTNVHTYTDTGGTYHRIHYGVDYDYTIDMDYRSRLIGSYSTSDHIASAWLGAARQFRGDVWRKARADPRSSPLSPIESVVPLSMSVLANLKREAGRKTTSPIIIRPLAFNIRAYFSGPPPQVPGERQGIIVKWHNNEELEYEDMMDLGTLVIGSVGIEGFNLEEGLYGNIETNRPWHAGGRIAPATRTRWTFENMYQGERIR